MSEKGDGPAPTVFRHHPTDLWSTYESTVQGYRQVSASSQSLFLTAGAVLLGWGFRIPFFTVMAMAMITTWYIWFPVIFSRTAIVDYHKYDLASRFDREGRPRTKRADPLDERDYARLTNFALRRRVYTELSTDGRLHRTIRVSRRKVDVLLPVLFTVVWVIFAVYVLIER